MTLEDRCASFKKLESLVAEKEITFYRLSKDIGEAPSLFTDWKNGKSMPKTDKLKKIADYFNVAIEYFLE